MRNEKKVNKAAYLVLCLMALAVSCLIFACFSPWQNETGKGTFSITIGGGGGRAAVEFLLWEPETRIADLEHTITLTNDSGLSMPPRDGVKAGQTLQFSVEPGHWVITVEAYLIIDGSKVLKARGSKPVNLKPGNNGAITIDMDKPDGFNPPSGNVSVTDVMFDSNNIRLRVGNQGILIATVEPDNATNKKITWESDNPSVAIVTPDEGGKGTVTAKGVGTAIITVTTQDGEKTASCTVEVVSADSEELTGTVTITGTAEIGQTLTADTGKLDKGTYTYQWKRGDTLENADRIGTNSSTYTTVSEDGGKYIWVFVTCAEYRGEVSATIGPIVIPVTLNSVTVNAPSTVNTTALILTFDKAIIGLTAEDITLGGVSGVNKGDLIVSNNGTVYTLSIGGFTSGGALTVTVTSPSGYRIIGSPKTVDIYYITYTVTFNSNEGSSVPAQTVVKGEMATRPANTTRSGYGFVLWYSDDKPDIEYDFEKTPITANVTLYAKWSATIFTVTFNGNGGSPEETNAPVGEGGTATPPSPLPTKVGYVLDGWYTNQDLKYNFDTPVTKSFTLYAKWLLQYTVTFNSSSGNPATTVVTVGEGRTATPPDPLPKRNGYIIEGWYRDAGFIARYDFDDPVTENIALYAKWNAIINNAPISGVTAPASGTTPVTKIMERTWYTGTVTWKPDPIDDIFDINTIYTATITLEPKEGYTLQGVAADFFKVTGATTTNAANSGVITAVFPATGALTSTTNLRNWLNVQPDNTPETPYVIALNFISGTSYTLNEAGKYVYLDLSGMTITSIAEATSGLLKGNNMLIGITIPDIKEIADFT